MEKLTFGFIKNKFFITGFIAGIIITAVVAILLVSFYTSPPGEKILKGTMLNWTPSVGDLGVIDWTGASDSCGRYIGVKFYNDPNRSLVICRPDGRITAGSEVKVYKIIDGKPCGDPPGGIWISPTKNDRIQIPK